jgi:hypothetical protein
MFHIQMVIAKAPGRVAECPEEVLRYSARTLQPWKLAALEAGRLS